MDCCSFSLLSQLALTVCNPWQWFCSTRALSNCLEMTVTTVALDFWPWQWSVDPTDGDELDEDGLRKYGDQQSEHMEDASQTDENEVHGQVGETTKSVSSFWGHIAQSIDLINRLRRCLLLAASACILRPTNVLIWICVAAFTMLRTTSKGKMLSLPWEGAQMWINITSLSLFPATKKERLTLLREVALCGYGFTPNI